MITINENLCSLGTGGTFGSSAATTTTLDPTISWTSLFGSLNLSISSENVAGIPQVCTITQLFGDDAGMDSPNEKNNGGKVQSSPGYAAFFTNNGISSNGLSKNQGDLRFGGAHGSAGFGNITNSSKNPSEPDKINLDSGRNNSTATTASDSPPPMLNDPQNMRQQIRQRMHRCKLCKNRFVEKDIYERHLKDKHPEKYEQYMEEQAKLMEDQRLAELEQIRREEIKSGGFIQPAREVAEAEAMADPNEIKLPEEDDYGHFFAKDEYGMPVFRKRTYRKKVSPQCPFCDKRFRNDNSLKKHVAKKHPDCISFVQCNKCFKCLPTKDDLADHQCELVYVCWECTPMHNMVTEERLETHRKKFHRGAYSGFKCPDCPRKFLTPRKLRKHKKMSHVVRKPYKCHFCDDYFPTDTQAALHERVHTGKVKFECNICDFRTNRFVRLHEHKRKEHGYICVICNEKTVEYAELKYHTLEKHGGYLSSESQAVCIESPRVWILFKGE